jgi:hypothetical protein
MQLSVLILKQPERQKQNQQPRRSNCDQMQPTQRQTMTVSAFELPEW